jgi:hypothetical protein
MSEPVTPADLSRELSVDPRRIRAALRDRYGKVRDRQETRWLLTQEQVDEVRAAFRKR